MRRNEWLRRLAWDDFLEGGSGIMLSEYEVERSWPLHGHEFYEMEFILDGTARQTLNGVGMEVRRGSVYLLTPADVHEIAIGPEKLKLVNVKFPHELIGEEEMEWVIGESGPICAQLEEVRFRPLLQDLERVKYELSAERRGKLSVIRATINRLLVDLLREVQERHAAAAAAAAPREGGLPAAMRRSLLFIHNRYREPLSLKDAASQIGLSPNYYSEQFHRRMGVPFQHYVLELRLAYADRLVRSSAVPLTDVAFSSGFNSLEYFIRAYKRKYGRSPGAARKAAAAPKS